MIDISLLKTLEPISNLSPSRMQELATLCFIEKVSKGVNPFRMNVVKNAQAMYLLKGQLELRFNDGINTVINNESEQARYPIDSSKLALIQAIALSEIEILRIDLDLLDIMITWDQLAAIKADDKDGAIILAKEKKYDMRGLINGSSAFEISKLQSGIFGRLPSANLHEMFKRMTLIQVTAGQIIIQQGTEGDYYYLMEHGSAIVSRSNPSKEHEILAELSAGDTFGEDALVSENKRNATVTMKTDGSLLRMSKFDFNDLLKAPLINQISMQEAQQKIMNGAIWLDVRSPSEYKFDHFPNAINLPLSDIRKMLMKLDKNKHYIACCQTGRRSLAGAFILIQNGINVEVLSGGIRTRY